jgi:hypothetical protein
VLLSDVVAADALNPDLLGPVLAVVTTFGATTAIVAISLYFRFRSQRLRQELYASFLEKGAPIPRELLPGGVSRKGSADLRRGLVLLLGGIGLSLSLLMGHQPDGIGFGLIPALIGVAFLIVWKIEKGDGEFVKLADG